MHATGRRVDLGVHRDSVMVNGEALDGAKECVHAPPGLVRIPPRSRALNNFNFNSAVRVTRAFKPMTGIRERRSSANVLACRKSKTRRDKCSPCFQCPCFTPRNEENMPSSAALHAQLRAVERSCAELLHALRAARRYSVATKAYLALGKDGYDMSAAGFGSVLCCFALCAEDFGLWGLLRSGPFSDAAKPSSPSAENAPGCVALSVREHAMMSHALPPHHQSGLAQVPGGARDQRFGEFPRAANAHPQPLHIALHP